MQDLKKNKSLKHERQFSVGEGSGPNRKLDFVNILAEDYESYGIKDASYGMKENSQEETKNTSKKVSSGKTVNTDSTKKTRVQCEASIQLDGLLTNVGTKADHEQDKEEINESRLLRFGPL